MQAKSIRTAANRQAAIDCGTWGLPVFPVVLVKDEKGKWQKVPCIKDYKNRATTDLAEIDTMWDAHPNAMPGIATGRRSGLFVIDLDQKNGKDGFAALRAEGIDPASLSPILVQSPGGSVHAYFEWEEGMGNRPPTDLLGVDARGEGGFVMAPGAVTRAGSYSFLTGDLKTLTAMCDGRTLPTVPDRLRPRRKPVESGEGNPTGHDPEVILSALAALPNTGGEFADRQDWLDIGMVLHCEFGGSEEGRAAFHGWSSQWPGYIAEATDAAYDSFHMGGGRTGRTIIWEAEQRGWSHPAVAELRARLDHESLQEDFTDDDVETGETAEAQSSLFVPASSYACTEPPERRWLVPGMVPARNVTGLNGDGGTGKSLLALQLAVAVATGTPFLGLPVISGTALFLTAEDEENDLWRRLVDICRAANIDPADLDKLMTCSLADGDATLATLDRKRRVNWTALYERVEAEVAAKRPVLLVLDTLSDLHNLDELNRGHGRAFVSKLRSLALRYDCTVLLLAHPSLSGMASGTGSSGSTAWNNSVRSRLYLKRVEENGKEDDPDARILKVAKANYGQRGGEIGLTYYNGTFVTDAADATESARLKEAKAERVFLKLLDAYTKQGRKVSPNKSNNYAPVIFSEDPASEGCGKEALLSAMNRLYTRKIIETEVSGPPSKPRSHIVKVNYADFD